MKQFGIMTYAVDASQQGLMIVNNLNKLVNEYKDICPIVFYKEYYKSMIKPNFPMMQEVEAWDFNHPIIATSLDTATRLLTYPIPTKKYFYLLNLEWLYDNEASYDEFVNVYGHEDINLIVRSNNHYNLVKDAWKEPIGIVNEFNYKQLMEIIS